MRFGAASYLVFDLNLMRRASGLAGGVWRSFRMKDVVWMSVTESGGIVVVVPIADVVVVVLVTSLLVVVVMGSAVVVVVVPQPEGGWTHVPASQTSPVQGSPSSGQATPVKDMVVHPPTSGSQKPTVQGLPSSSHGVRSMQPKDPTQVPPRQASHAFGAETQTCPWHVPVVHASSSLQGAPVGCALQSEGQRSSTLKQYSLPAHASVVHGLPSSHGSLHTPARQKLSHPPTVHEVPSGDSSNTQPAGVQVPVRHGASSALSQGESWVQVSPRQMSSVQGSPSDSHASPSSS
jgi:hypothetical protein